ncbi:MAG: Hsp20 family protein [Pseudomonadales bacterium]|nr:Hsp20 family protein [Pseudomonadales bacterium]
MGKVDLTPLYRSSIGFDHLGHLLDNALRADRSEREHPPCNIEVTGENRYRITLAVPGFTNDELEVQSAEGILTVRGKRQEEEASDSRYVHQGIHYYPFERRFSLADFVEVRGASLHHGLLQIDLIREVPDTLKPRRIEIQANTDQAASAALDQSGKEVKA